VIVTVAEIDTLVFWRLVAVILTVGFEGKTPGAVYLPNRFIVPAPIIGDMDQITAWCKVPARLAVNWAELLKLTWVVFGKMLMFTVSTGRWPFAHNATRHSIDKKPSRTRQILNLCFTVALS
jgi:hypothetical protein